MEGLTLAHGFEFGDLYSRDGLTRLDQRFCASLVAEDAAAHDRLMAARSDPATLSEKTASDLIVELAPLVEEFIAELFGIRAEAASLAADHVALAPLYRCKRLFVQRRAVKAVSADEVEGLDGDALEAALTPHLGGPLTERRFAERVLDWLDDEAAHGEALARAARFAAWATLSRAGRARFKAGVLFKVPGKFSPEHLIPVETEVIDGVTMLRLPEADLRRREGFALTDSGFDLTRALDAAHYCIFCHNQGKDSCAKGLKSRDGAFRKSAFGVTLAGCPLGEKISEMNLVKSQGHSIGALAVVVIDNPMAAATGHRICNDCMKSCIYQKQDPVDIPQIETRTLKDVLGLPWGFEIYSLLTRWNPLDFSRPLPRPASGRRVLIAGLGPAGFTLAHHLLNDGHAVVAVDGLKIEPLPPEICGVDKHGGRAEFRPVKDTAELAQSLDTRLMAGFGGVAEYGITVRWDKNFLTLVRLMLERRQRFAMFGGVRFGGTITTEDAFAQGFDHVALALGAGRPTYVEMPNALARGVRMASDFLMALQLTGAAKAESVANLQIRLPVVVVGGGLTAIDTATEALAYYPIQVEKFLSRFEALSAEMGEDAVREGWSDEEREIAEEVLAHARAIRAERAAAVEENRPARVRELLQSWGGVTLAYRRRLIDAPSYTLNHEEVGKALEEGIRIAEHLSPRAVETDDRGHAAAIVFDEFEGASGVLTPSGKQMRLPARSILIAAGTAPNTVLGREDPEHAALAGKYFQAVDESGQPVSPEPVAKPKTPQILMSRREDGRAVSFFGDLHPSYAGNVVKAMASAKQGYPLVSRLLGEVTPASTTSDDAFIAELTDQLRARVTAVNQLAPRIVEVVVRAPTAARKFRPGQFYRLQNYEARAQRVDGTTLAMEGLAMTGAWADKPRGLVSVIVLEMGGSSDLCALLRPGDPVVLMGPTGAPTETPGGETVLLVGGGLGNAVLFSIGRAFREAGSRVLYFAGYKFRQDRYKVAEIEAAADAIVWACDEAPGFTPDRQQDKAFVGNMVAALTAYGEGALGPQPIALRDVDRVITIGSDGMMGAVQAARHTVLKPYLKPDHVAIGSINSPMQCMLKEICAQCLQPQRDPETGNPLPPLYSCFCQDQDLDRVDFDQLWARLGQNALQERLTAAWIDRALKKLRFRSAAE